MLTRLVIAAALLLGALDAARASEPPIGSMAIPIKVSELAAAAGVHRVDAATLPLDIVRMAFASPDGASAAETKLRVAVTRALDRDAEPADVLPLPLGSKTWTNRVLRKPISDGRLAAAIFGTRSSALLYHALMGVEPATLAWLESNPAVLEILHRHAAVSAVYARSIRIKDNRVVTPGEKADEVWGSIVGADPAKPAAFIDKLFSIRSGRLAALYDTIAHLDPPRQAFAIGRAGDRERIAKGNRLLDAVTRHVPRWRLDQHPFMRSDVDGPLLLRVVRVTASGDLAPPAARAVWARMFGGEATGDPVDAASLAEMILDGGDRTARRRLDLFLFGQRALGPDPHAETASVVTALDGFRRYPSLMLTLESIGLGSSDYAAATGAAAALDTDEEALTVFQCGLAILNRARQSGTITPLQARVSIGMLVEAVTSRGPRTGVIAWIRAGLLELFQHALPGQGTADADALVLAAMAGPREPAGPLVTWENQRFRADLAAAEFRRLTTIRGRQDELPLDAALAAATPRHLAGLAHTMAAIVYANALGDPAGQAVAAGQVWRRHRLTGNDGGQPGQPIAWRLAREVFDSNGWHLAGSLLHLEAALAPLALRRLDATVMPASSSLSTMDRRTLAVSVALIEPRGLTDNERDAIAAALARGRARVARLATNASDLDAAADAAALSEWRRNAARWMLATTPQRVPESFSMLELFRLGGGDAGATWGTTSSTIDGCLCLRFPPRNAWEEFAGRPSSGQLASQLPDVLLRTAEILAARRLPAVLARDVVAFAMQEVLDRARPVYFDDWLAVAFAARDLRDEQFDDYISTLTVAGPLILAPKESR
jgi:hypothetical protein